MIKTGILLLTLLAHPVHVSVMSIDIKKGSNEAQVYLMVYFDDFLVDYSKATGREFGQSTVDDKQETREKLAEYLDRRIAILAPEKARAKIKSVSLEENELKLNITYKNIGRTDVVTVENSILTDVYGDQSNLVLFRSQKGEEGVKLTPDVRSHVFVLKQE